MVSFGGYTDQGSANTMTEEAPEPPKKPEYRSQACGAQVLRRPAPE